MAARRIPGFLPELDENRMNMQSYLHTREGG